MNRAYAPRFEVERLLIGSPRFVVDETRALQAYGIFVSSPHALATIRTIDTMAVREQPGVLAPTGRDIVEAGATAALAAVTNAVAEALPQAAPLDTPAPQRVWQVIRNPTGVKSSPTSPVRSPKRRER